MRLSKIHLRVGLLLVAALGLGGEIVAQSVSTVYSFTGQDSSGNPDFVTPAQGRDGRLYGTTFGPSGTCGTAFRMTTGGQATTMYKFGTDGCNPFGGMTLARDGNFYGTTYSGGASNFGVLFRLSPQGVFAVLHEFAGGSDGAGPIAPPVEASDGSLYGTTAGTTSTNFASTVYKYTLNSGKYSSIYDFTSSYGQAVEGPLVEGLDGNLYGSAFLGGCTDFAGRSSS